MADGVQTIDAIGVALTLDTTPFHNSLQAAVRERDEFVAGISKGITPQQMRITPQFDIGRDHARSMKVDLNQHFSKMAARGEAVAVPVKLGTSDWSKIRGEIASHIGAVPISVTIAGQGGLSGVRGGAKSMVRQAGGDTQGLLKLIEAFVAYANKTSMTSAATTLRKAAATKGAPSVPGLASGGYVTPGNVRLVGEEGPEVVRFSQPGRVFPTSVSRPPTFPRGVPDSRTLARAQYEVEGRATGGPAAGRIRRRDGGGLTAADGGARQQAVEDELSRKFGFRHARMDIPLIHELPVPKGYSRIVRGGRAPRERDIGPLVQHVSYTGVFGEGIYTGTDTPRGWKMADRYSGSGGRRGITQTGLFPASALINASGESRLPRDIEKQWLRYLSLRSKKAPGQYGGSFPSRHAEMLLSMYGSRSLSEQFENTPDERRVIERLLGQKGIHGALFDYNWGGSNSGPVADPDVALPFRSGRGLVLPEVFRALAFGGPAMTGGPRYRPAGPEKFIAAITRARAQTRIDHKGRTRGVGETVYQYPDEDYAQMRTFLDRDGVSGYAIKSDGDVVSGFNTGARGGGKAMIRSAVQRGGAKLDAFDEEGFLPYLYGRYGGFREYARDEWNPDYAPEGWSGDTPDVVYMKRRPFFGGRRKRAFGGPAFQRGMVGGAFGNEMSRGEDGRPAGRIDARAFEVPRLTMRFLVDGVATSIHGTQAEIADEVRWHAAAGRSVSPVTSPRRRRGMLAFGGYAAHGVAKGGLHPDYDAYIADFNSARFDDFRGMGAGEDVSHLSPSELLGLDRLSSFAVHRRTGEIAAIQPMTYLPPGETNRTWANSGSADYEHGADPNTGYWHPDFTKTRDQHQGKGLATHLYTQLERLTRTQVYPSSYQYEDGQALWSQNYRPFGWDAGIMSRADAYDVRMPSHGPVMPEWLAQERGLPFPAPLVLSSSGPWTGRAGSAAAGILNQMASARSQSSPITGPVRGLPMARRDMGINPDNIGLLRSRTTGQDRMADAFALGLPVYSNMTIDDLRDIRDSRWVQDGHMWNPEARIILADAAESDKLVRMGSRRLWSSGYRAAPVGWGYGYNGDEMYAGHQNRREDVSYLTREGRWRLALDKPDHLAGGGSTMDPTYLTGELAPELAVPMSVVSAIPQLATMASNLPQHSDAGPMPNRADGGPVNAGNTQELGGGVRRIGLRSPMLYTPTSPGGEMIFPHTLADRARSYLPRNMGGFRAFGGAAGWGFSDSKMRAMRAGAAARPADEDIGERAKFETKRDFTDWFGEASDEGIGTGIPGGNPRTSLAGFFKHPIQTMAERRIAAAKREARRMSAEAQRSLTPRILAGKEATGRMDRAGADEEVLRAQEESIRVKQSDLEEAIAKPGRMGVTDPVTGARSMVARPAGVASDAMQAKRDSFSSGLAKITGQLAVVTDVYKKHEAVVLDGIKAEHEAKDVAKAAGEKVASAGPGIGERMGATLATTVGFGLYNVGMQAFGAAVSAMIPELGKFGDTLIGFSGANTRATKVIGEKIVESGGNLQKAFGDTAASIGAGASGMAFLKTTLGDSSIAKGGQQVAAGQSDYWRGAAGMGSQVTGLYGGYGGVNNSGLFAEIMGGGAGYMETIGGNFEAMQAKANSAVGDTRSTEQSLSGITARIAEDAKWGRPVNETYLSIQKRDLERLSANSADQALAETAKGAYTLDRTEALGRGAAARGAGRNGTSGAFTAAYSDDQTAKDKFIAAAFAAGGDDAKKAATQFANANTVFLDATGNVITTAEQFKQASLDMARGDTVQSLEAYGAQQAVGLQGGFMATEAQARRQIDIAIPAAIGTQLAAQPILGASTGVLATSGSSYLGKSKGTVDALLSSADEIRLKLTDSGRAAVDAQTSWIAGLDTGDGKMRKASKEYAGFMATVSSSGTAIAEIQTTVANAQTNANMASYGNSVRLANRAVKDALGLAGQAGGKDNLGAVERQQTLLGFMLQQKQINFSTATAGFQAPGLTSEERGARKAQAILEAKIQQKQLDLSKQSFGISADRGVTDTTKALGVMAASHEAEMVAMAAAKKIANLQVEQGEAMQQAGAVLAAAEANWGSVLQSATGYTSVFGRTIGDATTAIRSALNMPSIDPATGRATRSSGASSGYATGVVGSTAGATSMTVGEAGTETVAVLRNPRLASMAAFSGGGQGGGGVTGGATVNLYLTVQGDVAGEATVAKIVRAVEDSFNRKAARIGMRTFVSASG